jgi:hypothetical protein
VPCGAPFTGRVGAENLPNFSLTTPLQAEDCDDLPGLRSRKDIDDVIAYITGNQ